MLKAYKYRIKDKHARRALTRHAYAVNQVWNWCSAAQRDIQDRYLAGAPKRPWPTKFDFARQCKGVGADLGIHQQTVQEVCRQFVQSRDKNRKCPSFRASFGGKRARGWIPFQSQSRRIEGNSIVYLGKKLYFWVGGRPVPTTAKGGAFTEDALGRWYVILFAEAGDQSQPARGEIGIDLGLKSLAALSTGQIIENPRHLAKWADQLATAQRASNKRRAKAIYIKIANARRDFHHKLSTHLAREYAFIAVGNVNAKNLAQTRAAKSVLDAGWSAFRNMLRYKAGRFLEVDERFTTQACSCCGGLPPERPKGIAGLGIRVWDCSYCGASHDRDVNAARNILKLARGAPRLAEESRKAA